jgi:hypothetical protein
LAESDSDDLISFREKAKSLSAESLYRDLAELLNDIQFLSAQVEADAGDYSPSELEIAQKKISKLRKKAEIAKLELTKKESTG